MLNWETTILVWTGSDRCCFVRHEKSDYRPHGYLARREAESKQGVFSLIEALSQNKYAVFESGEKHFANMFLVEFECLQCATVLVGMFGCSWRPWCSGWGGLVAQLKVLLILSCTRMSPCLRKLSVAPGELWKGGFAVNPTFFLFPMLFHLCCLWKRDEIWGNASSTCCGRVLFLKS